MSKRKGKRTPNQGEDIPEDQALSQYDGVILEVFQRHYRKGLAYLKFKKDELTEVCAKHGITVRNIPDIIYTYRARRTLPARILSTGHWAIEPAGRGTYAFRLLRNPPHFEIPFGEYAPVDIYNAIPEVVEGLLRQDEQSLLTQVLYNRLVDIFTGLTCFISRTIIAVSWPVWERLSWMPYTSAWTKQALCTFFQLRPRVRLKMR